MHPINYASKLLALQASKDKAKFDICFLQMRTLSSRANDDGGSNRGSQAVANAANNLTPNPYVEDMYKLWHKDNKSVHPSWDKYFKHVTTSKTTQPGVKKASASTNKINKEKVVQYVRRGNETESKPFVIQIDIFDGPGEERARANTSSKDDIAVDPVASVKNIQARSGIQTKEDKEDSTPPKKGHITHPRVSSPSMKQSKTASAPTVSPKVVPPKVEPPKTVQPKVVRPEVPTGNTDSKQSMNSSKPMPNIDKRAGNYQNTQDKKSVYSHRPGSYPPLKLLKKNSQSSVGSTKSEKSFQDYPSKQNMSSPQKSFKMVPSKTLQSKSEMNKSDYRRTRSTTKSSASSINTTKSEKSLQDHPSKQKMSPSQEPPKQVPSKTVQSKSEMNKHDYPSTNPTKKNTGSLKDTTKSEESLPDHPPKQKMSSQQEPPKQVPSKTLQSKSEIIKSDVTANRTSRMSSPQETSQEKSSSQFITPAKIPLKEPVSTANLVVPKLPQTWQDHVNEFKSTFFALTNEERLSYPKQFASEKVKTISNVPTKRQFATQPGQEKQTVPSVTMILQQVKAQNKHIPATLASEHASSNLPVHRTSSPRDLNKMTPAGGGASGAAKGAGGAANVGGDTNIGIPGKEQDTVIAQHLAVQGVIRSYQTRGHLIAHVDPLGILNKGKPSLAERNGEVSEVISRQHVALKGIDPNTRFHLPTTTFIGQGEATLPMKEIIKRLEVAYCQHIGVEFMYIQDMEKSLWIREYMESPDKMKLSKEEKIRVLKRVIRSVRFESFLQKKYPSEKRFGLEGGDVMVPCILQIMETGSELGLAAINIAMAHRGRLNVLANVCEKPLKQIFTTFQAVEPAEQATTGDVKYHLGTVTVRELENKKPFRVSVTANPSHLEPSGPVAMGKTKCEQFMTGDEKGDATMSILIHGDAAFCGQGVVYEGFHLSYVPYHTTHGTVHVVVNNQVGYTTDPRFSRSSPYCTDVGRVVMAPIFHVNGNDVEAVIKVSKMAMEWRQKFHQDVIIDIVCYRRNGHNELDEPMFTQPLMYQIISKLPNVEEIYTKQLISEGVVTQADVDGFVKEYEDVCSKDFELAKTEKSIRFQDWLDSPWKKFFKEGTQFKSMPVTGIKEKVLKEIVRKFSSPPPSDFTLHRGITRILNNRTKLAAERVTDWAIGEAIAFGSLMHEGYHVRLVGQDVERGTFAHRHHVLHDQIVDKKTFNMLANLFNNQAPYSVCNSSLSEFSVLGFELGYDQVSPYILSIWEAQFGDFSNTAQVIFDCFLSSGEKKWIRQSGLVALLPHAHEGMGPEHSSGRLERLLQLCDDDVLAKGPFDSNLSLKQLEECNWIVANCTMPANYCHLLRRQMLLPFRKPLMIMSPKSLLRDPRARSPFEDYIKDTQFLPVIPDTGPASKAPDAVKHLIFTCGHTYFDVSKWVQDAKLDGQIAITRTEQLSPFPYEQVSAEVKKYKNAKVYWAQEEHKNQGGWIYMGERINAAGEGKVKCVYIGRPVSSSPATGNKVQFYNEVEAFKKDVLAIV